MSEYTLYAIPFACSMAAHLALEEQGLPHHLLWTQRFTGAVDGGGALREVNPKAKVTTLRLPDGELLTETPAVLLYLDGLAHSRPPAEQRRLLEWLCFVSNELHKPILALAYDPQVSEVTRADLRDRLVAPPLAILAEALRERPTLLGGEPSVADLFAFWALLLVRNLWPERLDDPALVGFMARIGARPAAQAVMAREGAARRRAA